MGRSVISFLSDFGADLAPGICRGVMLSIAPDAQIVDVSHGIRKYAILEGAYVLWAAAPWLPIGIHVAVVDPGVGSDRRPVAIQVARGDVFVGPDNGLLRPAARVLGGPVEARLLENRELHLPVASATFHGRDIFSPVAAHLAIGRPFEEVGPAVPIESLIDLDFPRPEVRPGSLGTSVAFVDSFGNLRLFATPEDLATAFDRPRSGATLEVSIEGSDGRTASVAVGWSRTFADRSPGETLLYADSSGFLALADNQGDLAGRLGIRPGFRVRLHSPNS